MLPGPIIPDADAVILDICHLWLRLFGAIGGHYRNLVTYPDLFGGQIEGEDGPGDIPIATCMGNPFQAAQYDDISSRGNLRALMDISPYYHRTFAMQFLSAAQVAVYEYILADRLGPAGRGMDVVHDHAVIKAKALQSRDLIMSQRLQTIALEQYRGSMEDLGSGFEFLLQYGGEFIATALGKNENQILVYALNIYLGQNHLPAF